MRKKVSIVVAVLFIAFAGVIILRLPTNREIDPTFQGKPLSYWLQGYNPYGYSPTNAVPLPTRIEAESAVRQLGTNALPLLLQMLTRPDTPLRDVLFRLAMRQHLIKLHPPIASDSQQFVALAGLMSLGPDATPAVPRLIEIYNRPPNFLSRQIVPAVLGRIGPGAKAATPVLIRGATDTNDNVRVNSVFALGQIQAPPELVVPVLIKCLRDPNPDVRANAARSLGSFGREAQAAVPPLLELLKNEKGKGSALGRSRSTYNSSVGRSSPGVGTGQLPVDVIGTVGTALKSIDPEAARKADLY